jgi:ZIP family zinc transporter
MLRIILFSGLSGIVGTSLGGILGLFAYKKQTRLTLALCFASGVMIAITVFDLMPEAVAFSNLFTVLLGVCFGIVFLELLQTVLTSFQTNKNASIKQNKLALHGSTQHNPFLLNTCIILLVAIAVHNFPEGVAIGASNAISTQLSFTLACLLMLHNIPEGLAVSVSLKKGGVKTLHVLLLVFVAGAVTLFGGLIRLLLGEVSPLSSSFALSFAAGAMLYVSFCELLASLTQKANSKAASLFCIFGVLVGFFITNLI